MAEFENYYEILGISAGASPDEIKRAYLDKCFILHPDRMSNLPESARKRAEKELSRVNQAYDVLKDPYKRQAYLDRWFNNRARPRPVVKPSHILFGTLEPGQTKRTRFVIENSGGSYTRLWFSNPDSWLKVMSWRSLSGEELPLEVEIEATAPGWGETRNESIQVRLDDEETSLELTLEVRPGPSAEATPKKQEPVYKVVNKPGSKSKQPAIPRKRTIAYIACGSIIILAAVLIPLLNIPALARGMDVSLDQASRIAYIARNGGNSSLNLIGADGGGQITLQQENDAHEPRIKWSSTGGHLLFYSELSRDADSRISVINAACSSKNKYTLAGMAPAWSPDGRKIMFNSDREANRQVYIVEAGGGGLAKVTSEPQGIMGLSTAWSDSGRQINYLAKTDRGIDIFQVDTGGTDKSRLTGYPISDIGHFKWSPDGLRIAFTADGDLYIMNADGKNRRRLSVNGICGDYSWSGDSGKIAFCSYSAENNGKMAMSVAGMETYEPVRLLDSEHNTGHLFAWSPDSRKLAFVVLAQDSSDIFTATSGGAGISQLTANAGYNAYPSWSPDGRKIAYSKSSNRDNYDQSEIYIMHSDGSNKTPVCPGYYPAWSTQ